MASLLINNEMGTNESGSTRCIILLQRALAIQLSRGGPTTPKSITSNSHNNDTSIEQHPADEMWMYDKGYNLFQSFLESNSKCWWNAALIDATRQLRYKGHVSPGILMVGGPPCALEVLRAAWSRNVLRPPADHAITCLGDIEDCLMAPVSQGQFTPLPEALCWAILELTTQRQAATLDTLRSALKYAFPSMQRPSRELVYDALAKLIQERKIYHTSQGYFVVTPETKRLRKDSSNGSKRNSRDIGNCRGQGGMLMSNDEAMALVHGEMMTLRDGNVTHQAVQTNLADVICGGNPNDKVLFARCRSVPGRLERRHSLRIWGSAKRLHRSGSSRSLPRRPERSETSSSIEFTSTDSTTRTPTSLSGIFSEKIGLLSRLFRRTTRRKGAISDEGKNSPLMGTFSAQYPPTEWFNPRVVHLHSVATQTKSIKEGLDQSQTSFRVWDDTYSVRSATLPRRHNQQSNDSTSLLANSTPRSSRRHRSPSSSTLPRSKCSSLSRCTSRASVLPSTTATTTNGASTKTSTPLPSPPPSPISQPELSSSSSPLPPPPPTPPLPKQQQQQQPAQLSSSASSLYSTNKSAGSNNSIKTTNTNTNTLKSSGSTSSTNATTIRLGRTSSTRYNTRRQHHDLNSNKISNNNHHHHSSSSSSNNPTKSLSTKSNRVQQQKSNLNDRKTLSHSSSTTVNQKIITNSSSSSSTTTTTTLPSSSSSSLSSSSLNPWKMIQHQTGTTLTPLQETQNSITLQVSTNLSPNKNNSITTSTTTTTTTPSSPPSNDNYDRVSSNTSSTTTTISGTPGTKIYVHQNNNNLPINSIIKFDNNSNKTTIKNDNNHMYDKKIDTTIINYVDKEKDELISEKIKLAIYENEKIINKNIEDDDNNKKKYKQLIKIDRPSSLYTTRDNNNQLNDNKLKIDDDITLINKLKTTNKLNNNSKINLTDNEREKNTMTLINDNNSSSITNIPTMKNTNDAMNNSRKLSLSLSKDTLSYRNLLRPDSKNNIISNPPSPTKSFDGIGGSFNNVYIDNLDFAKKQLRAPQGSEPSLDKTTTTTTSSSSSTKTTTACPIISRYDLHSYPSLSDMQVQFTSLAAQKILNGCPINSVDTLVEVNMAASDNKPDNRDVTVHTDFGLV